MILRVHLLALAGAAVYRLSAASASALGPRQEKEDTMDLYLCSNPNFNHDCDGCACERMANLTTAGGYGGPPCYPLPEDLRVGNPQGVSSARSYSKWNCTLFDNEDCNSTLPGSSLTIPPGPPGMATLGAFDDRAVTYQCYALS
ncbi:hypothetical protein F4802DRAFT_599332 [Xylaria palmicola]|nr:hypothetical protein F4802DRAFT_599332 [Xylaria palmicola]